MTQRKQVASKAIFKNEIKEKKLKMSGAAQTLINSNIKRPLITKNRIREFSIPKTINSSGELVSNKLVTDNNLVMDENFSIPLNGYGDELGCLTKINLEVINSWFLGYGEYSILTQSGIMQRIIQAYALESTREGWEIKTRDNKNSNDKAAKINQIEARMKELGVKDKLKHAVEMMVTFGGGFIYPKIKGDDSIEGGSELQTPLYKEKIGKGDLEEFRMIEPLYCTPNAFNASNPLMPHFYKPQTWNVLGNVIHSSRLLHFKYNEVPTLIKPIYLFNGIPLTQLCLDHIYGYESIRHNIVGVIGRYNINIFKTNMNALINDTGDFADGESVIDRLKLANALRDNFSIFALNNDLAAPEEWQQFTMSIAGFSEVLAQNAELICAVACIPAVVLFGTTPKGFNATGDTELRIWYDRVGAFQNNNLLSQLQLMYEYVQLDLFGKIDDDLIIEFKPLWKSSALERSQIRLNKMQESIGYVDSGILINTEIRRSLAEDPESGYNSLLSEEEFANAVDESQFDNSLDEDEDNEKEKSST